MERVKIGLDASIHLGGAEFFYQGDVEVAGQVVAPEEDGRGQPLKVNIFFDRIRVRIFRNSAGFGGGSWSFLLASAKRVWKFLL